MISKSHLLNMPWQRLTLLGLCLLIALVWLGIWQSNKAYAQVTINFNQFNQQLVQKFGARRLPVGQAWQQLVTELNGLSDVQKLQRVNAFFHQNVRYRTDQQLYGMEDYWATPLETLGHGLGDCEDYAIAKYITLRKAGLTDQQLRLIYVRANVRGRVEAHMVLGYYATPNAEPLILDSLIPRILPASQRTDLTPVFSFNAQGLWAGNQRSASSPTARLSRWRSVLDRLAAEGIYFE
ncbi:transglutaminase-like cysteine peptidase [Thiomicrospira aerophila]|nr:transglutaminase-like cysteine peptidase [Thiomicrospira aerophila]